MYPASWPSHLTSTDPPTTDDLQALLQRAQALQLGAPQHQQLLLGKRLGLMTTHPEGEDAQLFEQAARGLGAHVSLIPPPTEQDEGNAQQLADIGRLLGRLYDTVECQGISSDMVKRLAQAGNLTMHNGLSGREHWLFQVAKNWRSPAALADRRRWLIQAVLLVTLS
ncbi:hypothetical protein [Roseateles sp. P5_E7]